MATTLLPPPPINDQPGSFAWLEWYRQLRNYVSTSGSVPWYIINFQGSNLTDIATRLHNQLQGTQGGTAGEMYHLTSAQYSALIGGTTQPWNPSFTNLTTVPGTGSISITGRYSTLGKLVSYTIKIVCTGDATTAALAGTTYSSIPVIAAYDDVCTAADITNNLGIGVGSLDSTTDRCYTPTWSATGDTIVISGKYETT